MSSGASAPHVRLYGIATMRPPWTKRCPGMVDMEFVPGAGTLDRDRREHPPGTVDAGDCCICGDEVAQQHGFILPPPWEVDSSVQFNCPVVARFRNHVPGPIPFEDTRVRQMVVLAQHGSRLRPSTLGVELEYCDMRPSCAVHVFFDEHEVTSCR